MSDPVKVTTNPTATCKETEYRASRAPLVCKACPTGAVCDSTSTVYAQRGFWQRKARLGQAEGVYKCVRQESCGGTSASSNSSGCAIGYMGPACARCITGWALSTGGKCNVFRSLVPVAVMITSPLTMSLAMTPNLTLHYHFAGINCSNRTVDAKTWLLYAVIVLLLLVLVVYCMWSQVFSNSSSSSTGETRTGDKNSDENSVVMELGDSIAIATETAANLGVAQETFESNSGIADEDSERSEATEVPEEDLGSSAGVPCETRSGTSNAVVEQAKQGIVGLAVELGSVGGQVLEDSKLLEEAAAQSEALRSTLQQRPPMIPLSPPPTVAQAVTLTLTLAQRSSLALCKSPPHSGLAFQK
jgi:hypothetical protein